MSNLVYYNFYQCMCCNRDNKVLTAVEMVDDRVLSAV